MYVANHEFFSFLRQTSPILFVKIDENELRKLKPNGGSMKTLIFTSLLLLSFSSFAKKNCTDKPESEWMNVEAFKKKVTEEGYTIVKFKQPGTCYEIYGKNKEGKNVEIYFNPVDGTPTKEKHED